MRLAVPLVVVFTAITSSALAQPRRPAPAPKPAASTIGVIKGTVIFEGEAPDRERVRRDTDPYCAKVEKLSEDVIVTKGKLKDVLVRIQNGTGGTHAVPATPVLLDQKQCTYEPRVVGVIAGQKLAVRNSDGTFHNVHGLIKGKNLFNKPHAPREPDLSLEAAAKPGDVIDLVCDVHPWMHSYAVVLDHPFFAVSADDGTFEIKGLAPGRYTLEAWHPTLGSKTMKVQIGKGKKAVITARFSYKSS